MTRLILDGNRFQFTQGEPIIMTLALFNCGDEPLRLFYSSSQRYDFVVQEAVGDDLGEEVWRWSAERVFAQVLGEEIAKPGESISYTEIWDQRNEGGQQVPSGSYHILGLSVGCTEEQRSDCRSGVGVFIEIEILP